MSDVRQPAVTPQPDLSRIATTLADCARRDGHQFDDVVDMLRCIGGDGPDVRLNGNRVAFTNLAGAELSNVADVEALLDHIARIDF